MNKLRITLYACLLGVIVLPFLYLYAPVPPIFEYVKWRYHAAPEIWIVPTPLAPDSEANPAAAKLNYFGYEFEPPTVDVKEERNFASGAILNFSQCVGMTIIKPSSTVGLLGTLGPTAEAKQYLQNLLGQDAASNYAFRSAVLNQTPGDLRLWSSPRRMARNSMLLRLKTIDSALFKSGLYSFHTPWMRGFQEGSLVAGQRAQIEAFDNQDRILTLIVALKPGKSCFGQTQLNQIIFSLRPVPAS